MILIKVNVMRTFVISIIIILMTAINMSSQDIEGVEVGTAMTENEVITKFGEPDYVEVHESCDGLDEHYYYNDSYLHFENNVFIGFCLRDPRFIALKKLTDTGIKVGDSLSL